MYYIYYYTMSLRTFKNVFDYIDSNALIGSDSWIANWMDHSTKNEIYHRFCFPNIIYKLFSIYFYFYKLFSFNSLLFVHVTTTISSAWLYTLKNTTCNYALVVQADQIDKVLKTFQYM